MVNNATVHCMAALICIFACERFMQLQCRHLIPARNAWADQTYYMTARPIATQFAGHGCLHDLTTERSFDIQATWVINVLDLFFDILSMGVCTARHWQTSSRQVQKLSACTLLQDWSYNNLCPPKYGLYLPLLIRYL